MKSTWSWPVHGEMMVFPRPDYGTNSSHWKIFCNDCQSQSVCFAKIRLWSSWAQFYVWHLFIGHQLGLKQLILIYAKWQDCFLITDGLWLVSWLSMCSILFLCHFSLLHNLIYGHVWLVSLHVWIEWALTNICAASNKPFSLSYENSPHQNPYEISIFNPNYSF